MSRISGEIGNKAKLRQVTMVDQNIRIMLVEKVSRKHEQTK